MLLTEQDIYHFREGTHVRAYDKLGAHPVLGEQGEVQGTHFAVWAPNAREVSVVGDFNGWDPTSNRMHPRLDSSGIWETFVAGVQRGTLYKYHIASRHSGYTVKKADPYAFYAETPPRTASVVWDHSYEWGDAEWLEKRARVNALDAPWCIYELHLGSWRRVPEEHGRSLTYRELAHQVADYVTEMGFTHVELMPVMEHPFYGSWGYQITGFYAPSARYGTPQDFMYFIDHLHRRGIGVILDWVPSHFPTDEHGLSYFDGTHLYEHADPRKGFHPEWNSSIFNYGRSEVRNFLASNAVFWLDVYHADALRVDAVASMLYLDYGRKSGEWIPNVYGGHENLEAVEFLKQLNLAVYRDAPHAQTIAEESTAWPMVSRPTYVGGLGFGLKWNMGWMHDTLKYFQTNPVHRKYVHNQMTFSLWYAFTENFVLPLSHDEVVHGKGSLIGRMPGDEWQQFAQLRLLLAYMWMHPGKKLLFMGGEIGQKREWHHEESLEWHVLQYPLHAGVQRLVRDLNHVVRSNPALYQLDFYSDGFQWVDANNSDDSVLVFLRRGRNGEVLLIAANFTPVPRRAYRVGAPVAGTWHELLNSDAADYGGSGIGNCGAVEALPHASHGQPCSLTLQLPPLALVVFAPARSAQLIESSAAADSSGAAGAGPGGTGGASQSAHGTAAHGTAAALGPQTQPPQVSGAQLNMEQAPEPAREPAREPAGPPAQPVQPAAVRPQGLVFAALATPWLATSHSARGVMPPVTSSAPAPAAAPTAASEGPAPADSPAAAASAGPEAAAGSVALPPAGASADVAPPPGTPAPGFA